MNKLAIAALSLGLLATAPATFAAPVTIDAGNFQLTYQDELLAGLTLSYASGVFTVSGAGLTATASGEGQEFDVAVLPLDSYGGKPFPIILTPKAGFQIAGVTETVKGSYQATAGQGESVAGITAGFVSRWVDTNGLDPLWQNTAFTLGAAEPGQSASGAFEASAFIGFTPVTTRTVALSALDVIVNAAATGAGSQASGTVTTYQLGVSVTPVPEPEALALMLAGLGVVGFSLSRRRG